MTPTLTTLPGTASVDDVLEVVDRDGGVIVADYVTPAVLDGLRADLLPLVDRLPTGDKPFEGVATKRLSALFRHSRHMVDVVSNPLFRETARRIIDRPIVYWAGGDGDRAIPMRPGIRIGATQVIQIGPGQPAQMLHRDDWAFLWRHHPDDRREARVQIMLGLSPFTAANGGTMVIPGSHRWDDDRIPDVSEAVPCEMAAGSALLWIGSTYHGGGANVTDGELRSGLTVAIDSANVRQEENMYLALPAEVVASYPEDIQRLLGWQASKVTQMGWVEVNGRLVDPIVLLKQQA